jgi:hypothetical protein
MQQEESIREIAHGFSRKSRIRRPAKGQLISPQYSKNLLMNLSNLVAIHGTPPNSHPGKRLGSSVVGNSYRFPFGVCAFRLSHRFPHCEGTVAGN